MTTPIYVTGEEMKAMCQQDEDAETEEVAETAEETNPREEGHDDPEGLAGARRRRDDNLRQAFGS